MATLSTMATVQVKGVVEKLHIAARVFGACYGSVPRL
jgi:hypothetical protein